ncbi:MAG TPA: NPCBM/NEW2 domain-containing protein, partial [Tepidisphaeraceae bacterium]|nr:NPCBM/NEW2 domain-containing protein [Tepidisphaeraceae bacterium]
MSTPSSALPIVPAQAGMRYLSDLAWAAMTNGWGPAEKDQSNADKPANDGRKITLNGQSYAKGLGVHANS